MLQPVLLQFPVQAEVGPPVSSDPLQLGQVHHVAGRRPLPVALRDTVHTGHAPTGPRVGGASLAPGKRQGRLFLTYKGYTYSGY